VCGGADLHNSINDYLLFASVHALSTTGRCHTFDAAADGIVLGEGVACGRAQALADAERDGDRIYAVIKGVAGAATARASGSPRRARRARSAPSSGPTARPACRRPRSAWSRPTAPARSSAIAPSWRP
jgi:3-oxoacyl-(acyl-carrier-protein) synthase